LFYTLQAQPQQTLETLQVRAAAATTTQLLTPNKPAP
jgi:hypothetical protein